MSGRIPHNRCDLKDKSFGSLTARYPTGETHGRSRIWYCECDCGNVVYATARDLNRGAVKSCGCLRKRPPAAGHSIENNLHFVDGTCIENLIASQRCPIRNATGVRGVTAVKGGGYVAYIGFQGKSHYLGRFDTLSEAASARKKAEDEMYSTFLEDYFTKTGMKARFNKRTRACADKRRT